jgi:hypothetical protein
MQQGVECQQAERHGWRVATGLGRIMNQEVGPANQHGREQCGGIGAALRLLRVQLLKLPAGDQGGQPDSGTAGQPRKQPVAPPGPRGPYQIKIKRIKRVIVIVLELCEYLHR